MDILLKGKFKIRQQFDVIVKLLPYAFNRIFI